MIGEIHILHGGVVILPDCLLEGVKERELVIDEDGVSEFECYIKIYCGELFQEGSAVGVKSCYAVFPVAEEIDNFLKGLSGCAICSHGKGILKAERRYYEVISVVNLFKKTEGHCIPSFHIALLCFAESYLGDLLRRGRGRYVDGFFNVILGTGGQSGGSRQKEDEFFHILVISI